LNYTRESYSCKHCPEAL